MNIAILTFEGFNEIDSFVSHHILTRVDIKDWNVAIACPSETVILRGRLPGRAGYGAASLDRLRAVVAAKIEESRALSASDDQFDRQLGPGRLSQSEAARRLRRVRFNDVLGIWAGRWKRTDFHGLN